MAASLRPVELVLFDLGGTLLYEKGPARELYASADAELWRVLRRAGVTLQPHDIYGEADSLFQLYYRLHRNDLNEPGSAAVLDGLLRERGFRLEPEVIRAALRAMFNVTQENWAVEEDAASTLRELRDRGFRLGVVSNGSDDDNTQVLVDKSGLRTYLEFVISSAAFGRRKPDPAIFHLALDHFGVAAGRAVMVGDSYEADIQGAHSLGLQTIWITRRVDGPLPADHREEAIVNALSQVPPLLPASR